MSETRNKLIRIAYENPHLRNKILPTLNKISAQKKKKTKVNFVEAILEKPTDLISWLERQEDAPSIKGWDIKSHHLTLKYLRKGKAEDLKPYKQFLGNTYTIDIVGYAFDDKCVAVLIDTNLPVDNKFPHITVAINGVPPKYSNELLEKKSSSGEIIKAKGKLKVKVGYFDFKTHRYDLPHEFFETDED